MLSIVIVNYNSWDMLKTCLKTLPQATSGYPCEVIVIDNGSENNESATTIKDFPWINLIRNDTKKGIAAACNQGILNSKGDYVLLLDPDSEAEPNAFIELVNFLDKVHNAGIVGPKIYYPDGEQQFSCGRFPSLINEFLENFPLYLYFRGSAFAGRYLYRTWDHANTRQVDWVTGACLLIRRKTIDQVGLLDESYFMYTEEVDWCYRAKEMGWLTYYYPKSVIIHHQGSSIRGFPSQKRFHKLVYRHYIHSTRLFFRKFYGPVSEFLLRSILLLSYRLRVFKLSRKEPPPESAIFPPNASQIFKIIINDLQKPFSRITIDNGNVRTFSDK